MTSLDIGRTIRSLWRIRTLSWLVVAMVLFQGLDYARAAIFEPPTFLLSFEVAYARPLTVWVEKRLYSGDGAKPKLRLMLCHIDPIDLWSDFWIGCWHGQTLVEFDQDDDSQQLTAHWHGDHEIDVTVPAKAHFETRRERAGDIVLHYQVTK